MSGSSRNSRIIRILIADDHPVIRYVVKRLLATHPKFKVIGEALDGAEAVAQTETLKPDVVVMNVTMPKLSGLEAAQRIKEVRPDAAVVILSNHADEVFIENARKSGASAYVQKSDAGRRLLQAIEIASSGEQFFIT